MVGQKRYSIYGLFCSYNCVSIQRRLVSDPLLMNSIFKKLASRKDEGIVRTLRANDGKIDFSSNDYLGMAASQALAEAIEQTYKVSFSHPINGSGGSRLLAGHYDFYEQVEKELARFFETEAVLIFNSGYSANLAI